MDVPKPQPSEFSFLFHLSFLLPHYTEYRFNAENEEAHARRLTGIILRVESYNFKPFVFPCLLLILFGWGGLFAIVNLTLPFVWFRWGFFVLLLAALTGTMLPIVYFFHRRFPSGPPAESNVIVRQAMWFGVYGATLAWLQLGRLVTVYVVLALAGGLIALEYVTRLREKSRWKPPISSDE